MSDNYIAYGSDSATTAAHWGIQRAEARGDEQVGPDDLLAGALVAVSRFGIVWLGETAIDLEALGLHDCEIAAGGPAKAAYSPETAAIFDRAAGLARRESAARVEAVHLLAAFAPETSGLMGELKRSYGLDDVAWRAGLARWPRGRGDGMPASSPREEPTPHINEFLSPEEAADLLGLHIQTIRGYVRSGKLPALRVAGERAIRIRRDDLLGLLEPVEPSGDGQTETNTSD